MFNIYVIQRGLNSIAGGVTVGAFFFYDEDYPEFERSLSLRINSNASIELINSLENKYEYTQSFVPFSVNGNELDYIRTLRITSENLVFRLLNNLAFKIDKCNYYIDNTLPNISFGNPVKIKSVNTHPPLKIGRIILNLDRQIELNRYHVLYPKYKLKYNLGNISPNHVYAIIKSGLTAIHRPTTLEAVADTIYKGMLKLDLNYLAYSYLYYSGLPNFWRKIFELRYKRPITKLKDYYTPQQNARISKLPRKLIPIEDVGFTYKDINHTVSNPEMKKWLTDNAPMDLRDEIIL